MVGPNFLGTSLFPSVPVLHPLHLLPSLPAACCLPGWADSSPPTSIPIPGSSHTRPPACCRGLSRLQTPTTCTYSLSLLPESSAWLATPHSQSRSPPTKHIPLIDLLVELKVQILTQSYPQGGTRQGSPEGTRGKSAQPSPPRHT